MPTKNQPQKTKDIETGTLLSIIFKSDKNNFIIGSFRNNSNGDRGREFIAKGNMFDPEPGLDYELRGKWENHDRYGRQFNFYWHTIAKPESSYGMYRYLVRICKWIGPSIANQIIECFRDKALEILKTNPGRVAAQIKGITHERAIEIQEALIQNEEIEKTLIELEDLFSKVKDVPKNLPVRLIEQYKADSIKVLKENPYTLTRIKGIGFHTADAVALGIGFDKRSPKREKSAIWHIINENMHGTGSVWISFEDLGEKCKALIGLPGYTAIVQMKADGTIVEREGFYTIKRAAENEDYIAGKIRDMMSGDNCGVLQGESDRAAV